jgi:hypothetical protein
MSKLARGPGDGQVAGTMSRSEDLPEAALMPPPIVTPEEDANRARMREEREERRAELGIPSDPADPFDPLRQPGESSSISDRRRRPPPQNSF